MCYDASGCYGRRGLKILVINSSKMWKSLKSDYVMMFAVSLMCWYCREASLLMRVHTNNHYNLSYSSYLT